MKLRAGRLESCAKRHDQPVVTITRPNDITPERDQLLQAADQGQRPRSIGHLVCARQSHNPVSQIDLPPFELCRFPAALGRQIENVHHVQLVRRQLSAAGVESRRVDEAFPNLFPGQELHAGDYRDFEGASNRSLQPYSKVARFAVDTCSRRAGF